MPVCAADKQDRSEVAVRALRYPGGRGVRTHENQPDKTFTISFFNRAAYPSQAVVDFYDRELRRLDWFPLAETGLQHAYRRWDCFVDLTQPGKPFIHQLGARWSNKDKSRTLLVLILYRSYVVAQAGAPCSPPDNDMQEVHVQLMPFVLLQ
jgi:hypothetical protein